jgi:hypothetical protein|nr:MAG TPA: hypothetical protein [Caudoviricetes sp.]
MKPMLFFEYETLVNLPGKLLIKKEVLQKLIDDAYAAGVEDGKKDALIEKLKEDSKPGSGSPLWNYRDIGSNSWWKISPTVTTEYLNKDAERQVQKELHPSVRTPDIKPVEITC